MSDEIFSDKQELIHELWEESPQIKRLLARSTNSIEARERFFNYLNKLERHYFNLYSDKHFKDLHICERANAKECIRILKNVIRTENEKLTHFSALKELVRIAKEPEGETENIQEGFLCEFLHLFRGIHGKSGLVDDLPFLRTEEEDGCQARFQKLDAYSENMRHYFNRYKSGTDTDMIEKRAFLKKKIMAYFKAGEKEWNDYRWHLRHIVRDVKTLSSLVTLAEEEREALRLAEENDIPFQITPYYLSLFDEKGRTKDDRAIRAEVLPGKEYCLKLLENRKKQFDMDFMGEKSTSPMAGITRRYPQIVILKSVDTCPQLCVYCQRNWELKPIDQSSTTRKHLERMIEWVRENKSISEVLVTGGDPLIQDDDSLQNLLGKIAALEHIERIRIGTRMLVTLPFRIQKRFVETIKKHHVFGRREICLVTHFEHPSEITPESIQAIQQIREAGIGIYNQEVFTYFNSLRYESCALRKKLKLAGVDPYYTFNTKGKEETADFKVPIARIEQERAEEARFLPGIVRTDESVFNVPKLGKSHLKSWQDHEIIMILGRGERVFRFYPWESKVTRVDDYLYTDISIYDYLQRLSRDGEPVEEYSSIWYYF